MDDGERSFNEEQESTSFEEDDLRGDLTQVLSETLSSLDGDDDLTEAELFLDWKEGKYHSVPSLPLVAYILHHRYGQVDIQRGLPCLRGSDAFKAQYLLSIAKELGFVVCLAHLTCTVEGTINTFDSGWGSSFERPGFGRGHGHSGYDEDEELFDRETSAVPSELDHISSVTNEILHLVRLSEGKPLHFIDQFFLPNDGAPIPEKMYEWESPDGGVVFPGTRGGSTGTLVNQNFERSVLVLFQAKAETNILMQINGLQWAVDELKVYHSNPKTPYADNLASDILAELVSSDSEASSRQKASAVEGLLAFAIAGKDVETWNEVIPYHVSALSSLGALLKQALDVFDLNSVTPGLLELVEQASTLQERCAAVKAIHTHAPGSKKLVSTWVNSLIKWAGDPNARITAEDISDLTWLAERRGFKSLRQILDKTVKGIPGIKERFDAVRSVQAALGGKAVAAWVDALIEDAVTSPVTAMLASANDVGSLLWIGEKKGTKRVEAILNSIVNGASMLKERFEIVKAIEDNVDENMVSTWIDGMVKYIASCVDPAVDDIPALIWVSNKRGLESVRKIIYAVVGQTAGLFRRFELVKIIETQLVPQDISAWVNEWIEEAMVTYVSPSIEDIPTIIGIAQKSGLGLIQRSLISRHSKTPKTYKFFVALANALHEHREQLSQPLAASTSQLSPTPPAGNSETSVSELVGQCIAAAIPSWAKVVSVPTPYSKFAANSPLQHTAKIDRVCELVELCITAAGNLKPSAALLASAICQITQDSTTITQGVITICLPLIPRLKMILEKHRIPVTTAPFSGFFKCTIALYLIHVLGPYPGKPPVFTESVACRLRDCTDCKQLDVFLKNTAKALTFKLPQARRTHIENQIKEGNVQNLISFETLRDGSPHTLRVSKLPKVVATYAWEGKQTEALAFLKSVGNDAEVASIMGDRADDISSAIHGVKAFEPLIMDFAFEETSKEAAGPAAASASTSSVTVPLAGVKRKRSGNGYVERDTI